MQVLRLTNPLWFTLKIGTTLNDYSIINNSGTLNVDTNT